MSYNHPKEMMADICDAVREKENSEGLIYHVNIAGRIRGIKTAVGGTAGPADIREGVFAYVDGEKVDGTLEVLDSTAVFLSDEITITKGTSNYLLKSKMGKDMIFPNGSEIQFEAALSRFGDAKPENVDFGLTFTSKEGLKLTGKRPVDEGNVSGVTGAAEADTLSGLHYWEKVAEGDDILEEKVVDYRLSYSNSSLNIVIYGFTHYADEIAVVDGALTLVDPVARGSINEETLRGKYIQNNADFYRIPADVTITTTQSSGASAYHYKDADRVFKLTCVASGKVTFVVSNDSTAFPEDGEQDGYYYTYKGTLNDTSADAIIDALTITENGTYTAPAGVDGYSPVTVNVAQADIPAVDQATPEITVSVGGLITASATQEAGQVAAGTKTVSKQLVIQEAQTITPGTSNKAIASGRYLTGTQTIKGDSNLKPENIKDGVTIFGIKGSFVGTSSGSQTSNDIEAASLSDVHYWTRSSGTSDTIKETYKTTDTFIGTVGETISYADEVIVSNGSLVLVNPKTYTVTSDDDAAEEVLLGKIVSVLGKFYRIPTEASIIYYAANQYMAARLHANKSYELSVVAGTGTTSAVVISTDPSAYPENGEQDGYTYVYQGTLSA